MTEELIQKIKQLPRDGEWWKNSGEKTFIELATSLLNHGYTDNEVVEFLSKAYTAVSDEFGS